MYNYWNEPDYFTMLYLVEIDTLLLGERNKLFNDNEAGT